MAKVKIIIEVLETRDNAFARHFEAMASATESLSQAESLVQRLAGYGLEVVGDSPPVPIFSTVDSDGPPRSLAEFASPLENDDQHAASFAVSAEIDESRLGDLQSRNDIIVWPDSSISLLETPLMDALDENTERQGGVDCRPHRPPVTIEAVRDRLSVAAIWQAGFRGEGVVVGVVDDGVNGAVYPVRGGLSGIPGRPFGSVSITSHGSMCAADVLVAAPAVTLLDYSFALMPGSLALSNTMQAILNQRRRNGTPHIITNSYGFNERPSRSLVPNHEVWNIQHVVHRKILEVVASGAAAFYAAGNCGGPCPRDDCHSTVIGPGASINAFNSLRDVITVAAVNILHERLGYSAQGPGGFDQAKPDISTYSHFFGNFGPGRPGGTSLPFDSGTSAAAPLAAGVAALLVNAARGLGPQDVKQILIRSAINPGPSGWNPDTGFGVINAARAFSLLQGEELL